MDKNAGENRKITVFYVKYRPKSTDNPLRSSLAVLEYSLQKCTRTMKQGDVIFSFIHRISSDLIGA
jgi:hypothetical protein